jgi:hypothetical protein
MGDLYDIARQVTDEVMGEGTYADLNRGNPDPGVQAAIRRAENVLYEEDGVTPVTRGNLTATPGHFDPDEEEVSITCPICGMTSYNPNDIREGYCGNCHDWTRGQE